MKIKASNFVKRQTAESPFSYYAGTWEELEALVAQAPPGVVGYKPGVSLVAVPAKDFFSGVVTLDPHVTTSLKARFAARRAGEDAFTEVLAYGLKSPAVAVEIVLYSRTLLVEEGEAVDAETDYQIVSINARTSVEPEPMTPMAMARNFLGLAGGTKAEYTAEHFAKAIHYWSSRAMYGGPKCTCHFLQQDPFEAKNCPEHQGELV
jgi:hypothetical protein